MEISERLRYLSNEYRKARKALDQLQSNRPLMLDADYRRWLARVAAEKRVLPLLHDEMVRLQRQLPPVRGLPVHGLVNVA